MSAISLRFRHLAIITALLFLGLACLWMLAPASALAAWGVGFNDAVGLVSRRAAAMYAGISVMLWLARNAPSSVARSALVAGLVTTCLLLALLGLFELAMGRANAGIVGVAGIEVLLALAFLLSARSERKQSFVESGS